MKPTIWNFSAGVIWATLVAACVASPDESRLDNSREFVSAFAASLKQERRQGLAADGAARYMSVITVDGVCLGCHGTPLSEPLRDQLDEVYPHDRARGYALGEIRGAFSVTWPAE